MANATHRLLVARLFVTLVFATRVQAEDLAPANPVEFAKLVSADAKVEKVAGDLKFLEGPVWSDADGGYLVFSDIPANELKKWTAKDGVTTFRAPSNNANGNTLDPKGNLVTAEHTGRRITATVAGKVEVVVDQFQGKRFSSPNDVVVKSDGSVWFTDPPYGIPKGETKEMSGNYVYRFDPATHMAKVMVEDFDMPNGLCFSPDEKKLYIADSGKPHHVRVFEVTAENTLTNAKVFCVIDKGVPDGIRCDEHGNLWSSAGDGVRIFAPDGAIIGTIKVGESPANLCFGGADHHTLFMTARKSLYAIPVKVGPATYPR